MRQLSIESLEQLIGHCRRAGEEYRAQEQAERELENRGDDWLRGYYGGRAGGFELAAYWLMKKIDHPGTIAYGARIGLSECIAQLEKEKAA